MENASKALLIAAAVLIVVLLIAFGMGIFNQAADAGDAEATADSIEAGITQGQASLQAAIDANPVTNP